MPESTPRPTPPPCKPCFTPEQHEEFWKLYAERIQPAIERASRSASRKLTGNGMNPDDMAAWIDDRVWALQRSGRWPFFHDSPAPRGAIDRIEGSIATLVRWAYLALSRKHWRRRSAETRYLSGLSRSERLAMVCSSSAPLEQQEELRDLVTQIREKVSARARARLAASWPEEAERHRVALALDVAEQEDEALIERVASGQVTQNTVDQMRSRSRKEIRVTLESAMRKAMLIVVAAVAAILLTASPAPAGEQTGGGRGGAGLDVPQAAQTAGVVSPFKAVHATSAPRVALVALGGEQTGGGRGG